MAEQLLAGKTAIVTGASRGIGLGIAEKLAGAGAELMLADVQSSDAARAHLLELGSPRVETRLCDIADEQAVIALAQATLEQFGKIDIIVNVAGIIAYKAIADLTAADWARVLGINLVGAALLATQGFRHMKPGGVILNVASVHVERTVEQVAPYAASKAALASFTRSAAIEGQVLGIRANAILPGAIDTDMLRTSPNVAAGIETFDPAQVGRPADIGDAALFLVSDASRFITGTSLAVDGGLLARL